MDILFIDKHLRKLCESEREAKRALGTAGAKKLRSRLADLAAVTRVSELLAGHPHPLTGDREGQMAINLDGGKRLVFAAANDPVPQTDEGSIDWRQVTAVTIVFIGDYHD